MAYLPEFDSGEFRCVANHYRICANRQTIIYTYIRKNGCSAFKRLIAGQSRVVSLTNRLRGIDRDNLNFIKPHKVSPDSDDVGQADHVIFVYRDPFERMVSLFLNKFVERSGANDIHRRFEAQLGMSASNASFEDFLRYLEGDFSSLDRHCYPQKAHLLDVSYTKAIELRELHALITPVIGAKLANRYFLQPVNAVSKKGVPATKCLSNIPADELAAMSACGKRLEKRAFYNDAIGQFIRARYAVDYRMIDRIRENAIE